MKSTITSTSTTPAAELPLEYSGERRDLRTPLVERGEVGGVFVNRTLAEETRRFLAGLEDFRNKQIQ